MIMMKRIVFLLCIFLVCTFSASSILHAEINELPALRNSNLEQNNQVEFKDFIKPVAISQYDNKYFVLDEEMKAVKLFTQELQLLTTIDLSDNKDFKLIKPCDLAVWNGEILILDCDQHCIFIINQEGKLTRKIGRYGTGVGEFIYPQAISIWNDRLYVGDAGNSRIQVFAVTGSPIRSFGKKGKKEGEFSLIQGLYATKDKIYISDGLNHTVAVFTTDGEFIESFGNKGHERGKLLCPQGLVVDTLGNIIVADAGNNRIQKINTLTLQSSVYHGIVLSECSDYGNDGKIERPSKGLACPRDVILDGEFLIIIDTANRTLRKTPLQSLYCDDKILLSQNNIDFGTIAPTEKFSQTLSVRNLWNPIQNGVVHFNSDFLHCEPAQLNSDTDTIKILVDGQKLEQGKVYMETITISATDDHSINIPTVFRANVNKDFFIEPIGLHCLEKDHWTEIPIIVHPQNGFEGEVTFSANTAPQEIRVQFDPPSIDVTEETTVTMRISTHELYRENSQIPIQIDSSGPNDKVHSTTISLPFRNPPDYIPTTTTGELFTATWCLGCVYSHTAMRRIEHIIGPDYATFISYYVDSTSDHPVPRLSWIESEDRMRCYMHDKGLPTIFFGGTDYLKGVSTDNNTPESKKERMFKDYFKKTIEKSYQSSPVRIQSKHVFDEDTKAGKIHVAVESFENLPQNDLHLLIAIVESNIKYNAVCGDEYHNFVLRDFITPANDNENDYLGTPMLLTSGNNFGSKGDCFDLDVDFSIPDFFNPDNLSIVFFVQDNSTKKVLQSVKYPVKNQEFLSFDVVSDGSLFQRNIKGNDSSMEFDIINSGNVSDQYKLTTKHTSENPWNYSVTIDGENRTDQAISIDPYEKVTIHVQYDVPDQEESDKKQEFTFLIESITTNQKKELKSIIRAIENSPPDFNIEIQQSTDLNVMAGEKKSVEIFITPNPYIDDPVELTLLNPPADLASYAFSPSIGNAPLQSTFTFSFHEVTLEKDVKLSVQAKAGTISKTAFLPIHVLRNPDAHPPELRIISPSENLLTNKPDLTITGTTDPTATLTICGESVQVSSHGSFEHAMTLKEGLNSIDFIATNRRGLTTQKTLTVELDITPPILTIKTEIPKETIDREITITGITEPGCTLTIVEQTIVLQEDGSFSVTIPLTHGWNTIVIDSTDQASNKTSLDYVITVINKIVLQIGNLKASVNDEEVTLDTPPYIKNGRTMVPFRFISESFGAHVIYDAVERSITLYTDDVSIWLQIGNPEAYIETEGVMGREKVTLEAPPEIVNNRTFVPLRFIGEAFGASIDWNGETREITITN
jgi:hypothetical protein